MKNNFKNKGFTRQQRGFTLIELLVVVAILGLLASLIIISTNESRARGRDARRIADIQALTDAIELYLDENVFPPEIIAATTWVSLKTELEEYFRGKAFPADPNSSDTSNVNHYVVCTSRRNYLVASLLETTKTDILGDIDAVALDIGYALDTKCIMDNGYHPTALDCQDGSSGNVDGVLGTVLCQGYLNS